VLTFFGSTYVSSSQKGGVVSAEHRISGGSESQENIPRFAIHFKVTIEIAIVFRRGEREHEVAQKQKTSKVDRPERFRKNHKYGQAQAPLC
jgi:hypothetical protein